LILILVRKEEEMKKFSVIVAGMAVIALVMGLPQVSWAVQGACVNCHTMHNSQGGQPMATGDDGTTARTAPYEYLLRSSCIGCHTGDNDGASSHAPYVMSGSAPTYGPDYDGSGTLITNGTTLAGGTFYWVASGQDAVGHNVADITSGDSTLSTPPGFQASVSLPNGGTGPGSWSGQVSCAGVYGCHGDRTVTGTMAAIKGAHHSDATGALSTADTVGNSYRFLYGIYGHEDSDYEYQPDSSNHNQYYGKNRAGETETDLHTISYFCAECHGDFHNGTGNLTPSSGSWGSPWLRHPTDYAMPNSGEYQHYADASGTADGAQTSFNYVTPVASQDVTNVLSAVTFSNDTIVMCLSCHRAHGTKYSDILRWDYSKMVAGNAGGYANKGCFACHTSKD